MFEHRQRGFAESERETLRYPVLFVLLAVHKEVVGVDLGTWQPSSPGEYTAAKRQRGTPEETASIDHGVRRSIPSPRRPMEQQPLFVAQHRVYFEQVRGSVRPLCLNDLVEAGPDTHRPRSLPPPVRGVARGA